jgi:hypothetical protein
MRLAPDGDSFKIFSIFRPEFHCDWNLKQGAHRIDAPESPEDGHLTGGFGQGATKRLPAFTAYASIVHLQLPSQAYALQ